MKDDKKAKDKLFADMMGAKAEFIPIIGEEEEELLLTDDKTPEELSILPLRGGNVLYPGVIMPVTAGRKKSIQLLKQLNKKNDRIGVVAQRNNAEEPTKKDMFHIGTVARVMKLIELPDGNTMAILQGVRRIKMDEIVSLDPFMTAKVSYLNEPHPLKDDSDFDTQMSMIKDIYDQVIKSDPHIPAEAAFAIKNISSPRILMHFIVSHLEIPLEEKQQFLELEDITAKAANVIFMLTRELKSLEIREEIRDRVKNDMDRQQRDFILGQQMRAIQEELGEMPGDQDFDELSARASKKHWNEEINTLFYKELNKLKRIPQQSPDYSTQFNYLTTLLDLPWNEFSKDHLNLDNARKILDHDHSGLDKIKERIIEYLAVLKLKNNMKSPILCFVGPPGVGKTSLGKSIARAIGRKYVRVALGGLHDEAEIRGHRKTYIGAMPGRIIQNIKKAGTSNPVFILDEIDKVNSVTHNGDPASALLEVLDPEQNTTFHDNYLDVDYDLSNVMFIATANSLSTIPPALLDRMEVIDVSGYIIEEKLEIAKRHLIPKQLAEHGLKKNQFTFSKPLLETVINNYTRESGVRQLEKTIAKIIRHNAVLMVKGEDVPKAIQVESLKEILGLPIHHSDEREIDRVGVVTGLAWTSVGGEILFIESTSSKGKGNLTMTGNLGDVMKESATLAYEYIKANAENLGINPDMFENINVHIHVPEGATPKDGPSAGITIFTSLLSTLTNRKVRSNFALTGEITLRGRVTPVGGIREKILAAKRAKITDIILCEENKKDIEEIPQEYINGLNFHYINEVHEITPMVLV